MNSDERDEDGDDGKGDFNIVGKQILHNCAAGPKEESPNQSRKDTSRRHIRLTN